MKDYIVKDAWKIIEEGWNPANTEISESLFSIGNGQFGQRANFEEAYSGNSLQGSYVAGIYYPDKTRVGWWKNGYPEYFAKVLNSTNWIGIDIDVDGEPLDLYKWSVSDYRRTLDMQTGLLTRSFKATSSGNTTVEVEARRFCSLADSELAAIEYRIRLLKEDATLTVKPYLDGNVVNQDSNYDEVFWDEVTQGIEKMEGHVQMITKKTGFTVNTSMDCVIAVDGVALDGPTYQYGSTKYAGAATDIKLQEGQEIVVHKFIALVSSLNHKPQDQVSHCRAKVNNAKSEGFEKLYGHHAQVWKEIWSTSDIVIEGDVASQQGIRFNIFQLNQTYTGKDDRLNIGPKGFTGEKYGGSTYWDTEAYCLPFYLATSEPQVSKNLLLYRYKHLQKAIENAEKLGFKHGAALYPMVTINGEECHNEWEITFEEIHRNGAIAFAIYDYVRYTGDEAYIDEYGIEVLLGISRFWSQRVHFSEAKQLYVMHGVTGPNEYENNVNNNWYTSTMALWTLKYTLDHVDRLQTEQPHRFKDLESKTKFHYYTETNRWKDILDKMFLPYDEQRGIFLQQDDYLDKEQVMAADITKSEIPIWQHWSWDRILRSCFIKQADVLQGIYLLDDRYDDEIVRRNFEFYEPRTVHESSLSPCVHVILAARLGMMDKAYEMYLRTSRLDLDNYNNDTEDGLHITSMAGTWMSLVKGFGGMRVIEGKLSFKPVLPKAWDSFQFMVFFRGSNLRVKVDQAGTSIINLSNKPLELILNQESILIEPSLQEV